MNAPHVAGSIHHKTPTQLAEAAIAAIAEMTPKRGTNANRAFEVGMDLAGRIVVDRLGNTPAGEWIMTCTTKSDPDVLADEIRAEIAERGTDRPARRVVVGAEATAKRRRAA